MLDRYGRALDLWRQKLSTLEADTSGNREEVVRGIARCRQQIAMIEAELKRVDDDYERVVDP